METISKPRGDHPGAWHHVTNRGLAHRPAFEGRSDVRAFLALLAAKVRDGQVEVHSYAILTTHFHLLLRSTKGELSDAMMWIENRYVKHFNRLRGRDGSLFRSRFRSRLIDTEEYWFNVIRYIDANPVDAGLCARAGDYEFGSARMYCGSRSAPWLSRERSFEPADYEWLFGSRLDPDEFWIIERRLERGTPNRHGDERGNELLHAAPAHVIAWLRSRAELADGGSIGLTLAAPAQVERLVRISTSPGEGGATGRGQLAAAAWRSLEAGLLREFCGLTYDEAAARMRISGTAVWKLCKRHRELLSSDACYAESASRVVRDLQRECVPVPLRGEVENPGGLDS